MSNSIWKTKAIVPEENGKQILVKFQNNWWHTEKITRRTMREWPDYYETGYLEWCYLDDLIAQADKAERLQKAVDLAVDTLKKAETTRELTVKGHYVHAISLDELHSALVEIKQLIKGE